MMEKQQTKSRKLLHRNMDSRPLGKGDALAGQGFDSPHLHKVFWFHGLGFREVRQRTARVGIL